MAPKLLYFVTEDWYFCSHRLPLAIAAKQAGYEVIVVTRVQQHGDMIRDAGLTLIPFKIHRSGLNLLREMCTIARLIQIYRCERPAIVHHVSAKPVLYGSIAARAAGIPLVINTLAGMGWLLSPSGIHSNQFRWYTRALFRRQLRRGITVVQNSDDLRLLMKMGLDTSRVHHIAGSGVDLSVFIQRPEPEGTPTVVLPARFLWSKGIGEFVAAARLLRARGVKARFILAGKPDEMNPAAIAPGQLAAWAGEGIVECPGWIDDMPALLESCHIVCLPSYREGLPKALLEALATGRPIVTTDVAGCREVVHDGDNGLLVPARDPLALANALERLITDPLLRHQMGQSGRLRAEQEFGHDRIIPATLEIYRIATGCR